MFASRAVPVPGQRREAAGPLGRSNKPGVSPGLGACSLGSGKHAALLLPRCLGGVFQIPPGSPTL